MLDTFLLKEENKLNLFLLFIGTLGITLFSAFLNFPMGKNSMFLVSLITLGLAYPVTRYIRFRDREEITKKLKETTLLKRHEQEVVVYLTIFLAVVIGIFLTARLTTDFSMQQAFLSSISGNATSSLPFTKILLNNLLVLILTLAITLLLSSGLLLVLVWNASIIAYALTQVSNPLITGIAFLGHGLVEVAGYIIVGIAASLLSYKIENYKEASKSKVIKDVVILTAIGITTIFLAAILEVI
ncbi:stage II sporulation protein M [Candidatus Woesearchaeota archaeon]|nr:stage II sporulation protein M [Candidatus Woesearchaeota archaeon]